MKNLYALVFILSAFCPLTSVKVSAQTQLGINYQAVARDVAGAPLATQTITVDFVIHRGSAAGPSSWNESFSPVTNQFGLFSLVIGSTSPANFDTIGWNKTSYWLEVFVNTISMGTTKFQSVPYAKHASTAGNGLPPGTTGQTLRHDGTKWTGTSNLINDGTNVGIGAATPSAPLDVQSANGTVRLLANSTNPILMLPAGGGGKYIQLSHSAGIDAVFGSNGISTILGSATNHHVDILTNGAIAMRLMNNGSVGIGNTFPSASSLVEITSTTKGILIPRMTTAQRTAIGVPATGLLVYDNTVNSFYFYNGSAWVQIQNAGGSGDWTLSGNTLTGAPTTPNEWMGSASSHDLIFKTSNIERMRILSSGNVSISNIVNTAGGAAAAPAYSFSSNTNTGMFLNGGNLGFSVAGSLILELQGGTNATQAYGQIRGIAGNQGTPSFAFSTSTTTGMFNPVANQLAFTTLGAERMRIDAAGNVGIGITAPTQKLHILGNEAAGGRVFLKLDNDNASVDASVGLSLVAGSSAGSSLNNWALEYTATPGLAGFGGLQDNGNGVVLYALNASGIIKMMTGGSNERMRIDNTGNVGIGTTSPGAKLEVNGQIKITDGTQGVGKVLTSDASGLATWQPAAGGITGSGTANYIPKWTGANSLSSTSSIYEDGSGNVGIGTAAPTGKLEINVANNLDPSQVRIFNPSAASGQSVSLFLGQSYSVYQTGIIRYFNGAGVPANSRITMFNSGDSEGTGGISVIGGGNVGIGTTSPTAKLTIQGANVLGDDLIQLKNASGNTRIRLYTQDGGGDGGHIAMLNSSGTNAIVFDTRIGGNPSYINAGNVGIGTSTPGAKLEVAGQIKIVDGTQGVGKVLTSDAGGLATWQVPGGSSLWTDGGTVIYPTTLSDFVGIGTAAPTVPLQVNNTSGQVGLQVDGTDPFWSSIYVNATAAGAQPNYGYLQGGTYKAGHRVNAAGNWLLDVNGQARVTVLAGGNVGIATTSPQDLLDVYRNNTTANDPGQLRLSNSSSHTYFNSYDNGVGSSFLDINPMPVNGTDAVLVRLFRKTTTTGTVYFSIHDGSGAATQANVALSGNSHSFINVNTGNVGIGNNTPGEKLDVTGNVQFSNALMPAGNAGNTGEVLVSQGTGAAPVWSVSAALPGGSPNQTLRYGATQWVAAANLLNDGTNVGIGTTPTSLFHLSSASSTSEIKLNNSAGSPRTDLTFSQGAGSNAQWGIINEGTDFRIQDWTTGGGAWTALQSTTGTRYLFLAPAQGNVSVGTNSISSTDKLTVEASSNNAIYVRNSNSLAGATKIGIDISLANGGNYNEGVRVTSSGATTNYGFLGTANGSAQVNFGGSFSASGGTTATNYGLYASASGGSFNYAAVFDQGNVGIGITNPTAKLQVDGTNVLFNNPSGAMNLDITGSVLNGSKLYVDGKVLAGSSTPSANTMLAFKDGHVQSQQTTAPVIAAVNCNCAPTLSNATDVAGRVNFTPGATATAGAQVTVTFNKTYAVAPIVVLTPYNSNAATAVGGNAAGIAKGVYVTSTTAGFTINYNIDPNTPPDMNGLSNQYTYYVIETQ